MNEHASQCRRRLCRKLNYYETLIQKMKDLVSRTCDYPLSIKPAISDLTPNTLTKTIESATEVTRIQTLK